MPTRHLVRISGVFVFQWRVGIIARFGDRLHDDGQLTGTVSLIILCFLNMLVNHYFGYDLWVCFGGAYTCVEIDNLSWAVEIIYVSILVIDNLIKIFFVSHFEPE